jgi:hypothetical protein
MIRVTKIIKEDLIMSRGGKREGSGRKKQGLTRKVSINLSEESWQEIEESGKNVSLFLKSLMENRINNQAMNEVTLTNNLGIPIDKSEIDRIWNIYIRDNGNNYDGEVLEKAYNNLTKSLLKGINTSERYQCPFTGKWFASTDKLIKSGISYLVDSYNFKLEKKREKEAKEN